MESTMGYEHLPQFMDPELTGGIQRGQFIICRAGRLSAQ
jgi:hypothetical protein